MRTIEVNLYSFDELSVEAKQKAIQDWRNCGFEYPWINETNDSLQKFCNIFNIEYSEIDYLEPYRNRYSINLDPEVLGLSGWRLATYIWNNYQRDIFAGKYYGKLVNGKHIKRYSKCQLTTDCVMTGFGMDMSLLDPIYNFLKNPTNTNFEELLNECISTLCSDVGKDIEYQDSDENISEILSINEYEFDVNGNQI